ncbi:hypothetical protein [Streptomyces sp. NPDC002564]|uniref:hypothetical protein n=1 Tax=Streptomyces sp. NPDC002564 TaxID=3364649 RepID=UPI0036B67977
MPSMRGATYGPHTDDHVADDPGVAGKPGIARCLPAVLPDPWPTFGRATPVDTTDTGAESLERARFIAARAGDQWPGPDPP